MDLNAPLGLDKPPTPARRRLLPLVVGATVTAALAVGLTVILTRADPQGGEPYAVALVPPPPAPKSAPLNAPDTTPTGSIAETGQPNAVGTERGVKVVTPNTTSSAAPRNTGPFVIDVSKALDERARRVAAHEQPAQPRGLPTVTAGRPKPRIAIVVGALGLSASTTRTATEIMPPAVSFAFVPNGDANEAAALESAKAKGHEILLQLPMQSAQGSVNGPHTLRAGASGAELSRDLAWLTGSFGGYVGVTNLLGAPVTANPAAMTTILKTVGQRGLFYLDDGTSRRSIAPSLGTSLGVPTLQADVVLDATADSAVVQANLEKLAAIARTKGSAIGMASGLTDHLAAVGGFAAALDARGFTLVPVSTIARSGGNFATAR